MKYLKLSAWAFCILILSNSKAFSQRYNVKVWGGEKNPLVTSQLTFIDFTGSFSFVRSDTKAADSKVSIYLADSFESTYELAGKRIVVTTPEELIALIKRTEDLKDKDVLNQIRQPQLYFYYSMNQGSQRFSRGQNDFSLRVGLGFYIPRTIANPTDGKVRITIDEASYRAGMGGTYQLAGKCYHLIRRVK